MVDRVEAGIPTGWATNGAKETLGALARGQVRQLVVRDDVSGSGFRCRTTGLLALTPEDCPGQGDPIHLPNLVDHVIEEALRPQVEVVVIDDPAVAARVGGLAATLRFRSTGRR